MRPLLLEDAPKGVIVRALSAPDIPQFQRLYDRCSDYVVMLSGDDPSPMEAKDSFESLPPGKAPTDKMVIGVFEPPAGGLIGVIDLVMDYPEESTWSIGLLMLDPTYRGYGLGSALSRWIATRMRCAGASRVSIGVLEENDRALSFWRREGFEEICRRDFVACSGKAQSMFVMLHQLPA